METPYESLSDFTNSDWTMASVGFFVIVLGFVLSGRKESWAGAFLWSPRNFATFLILFGFGVLGMWLSNTLEDGLLETILFDGANEWANTIGLLTGLSFTGAVIVATTVRGNNLPKVSGAVVGAIGFTVLFASGLTITVQSFYNDAFDGGSWADIMPLFPMNEFIAMVWATATLGLAVVAANGIVKGQINLIEGDQF